MSDSDDSDDSERAFDVEIEKCEKRLQLARYKKKYRNEWDYITNRWQNKHIHIVLKDIEQKWRVYSAGSHGSMLNEVFDFFAVSTCCASLNSTPDIFLARRFICVVTEG